MQSRLHFRTRPSLKVPRQGALADPRTVPVLNASNSHYSRERTQRQLYPLSSPYITSLWNLSGRSHASFCSCHWRSEGHKHMSVQHSLSQIAIGGYLQTFLFLLHTYLALAYAYHHTSSDFTVLPFNSVAHINNAAPLRSAGPISLSATSFRPIRLVIPLYHTSTHHILCHRGGSCLIHQWKEPFCVCNQTRSTLV